ncbi:hypothetical protein ACERK3_06970 [Phycisphaerales bacterium AB-hyl4]|uniref:Uncharacterized protein n=1 Tax=Natronomicrosphaera hydrolytica TaxID=3242702 RepID=A0ABV4U370_9BACT
MAIRKNQPTAPCIERIAVRPASEEESATAIAALDALLVELVHQVRADQEGETHDDQ